MAVPTTNTNLFQLPSQWPVIGPVTPERFAVFEITP
jgi:hypothetical protein